MSERREDLRRRVYLGGRIIHRFVRSDTSCLLRNLSPGGARLALSEAILLPDVFDLVIDAHDTVRTVEIVWRDGDGLGVRFLADRDDVAAHRDGIEGRRRNMAISQSRIAENEFHDPLAGGVMH